MRLHDHGCGSDQVQAFAFARRPAQAVTRKPTGGIVEAMGPDPQNLAPGDTVDERGVVITAAGRAKMRARMDAAAARDPRDRAQALAAFRARLDAAMTGR